MAEGPDGLDTPKTQILLIVTAIRQFAGAVPEYEASLRQIVTGTFGWLRNHDIDATSLITWRN